MLNTAIGSLLALNVATLTGSDMAVNLALLLEVIRLSRRQTWISIFWIFHGGDMATASLYHHSPIEFFFMLKSSPVLGWSL